MPVSLQENLSGLEGVRVTLEEEGITPKYLANKLKDELEAEGTKKHFDGGPGGTRRFVESDAFPLYDIRQKARMDAQKLLGMYPAEKLDVKVKAIGDFLKEIDGQDRDILPSEEE